MKMQIKSHHHITGVPDPDGVTSEVAPNAPDTSQEEEVRWTRSLHQPDDAPGDTGASDQIQIRTV